MEKQKQILSSYWSIRILISQLGNRKLVGEEGIGNREDLKGDIALGQRQI